MNQLILKAHAKINLYLRVGRRRRDGYHLLETLFQEISLYDSLSFRRRKDTRLILTASGRSVPLSSDNLILRALTELRTRLGVNTGMSVHLTKNIPIGAGLGGGSSDAAAALWGGWLLWTQRPKSHFRKRVPAVLHQLARRLGADVPFFLRGGRARARGIGDRLTSVSPQLPKWMILVYPRIHVSTKEAYSLLDRASANHSRGDQERNSFEPVVFRRFPKIGIVKQYLLDHGCAPVLMSGSGSSVFGFVKNKARGRLIRRKLRAQPWDTYLVSTVSGR